MTLRLAYSPDADDAFMFRAALEGCVDTEGLSFEPATADTQSLNDAAMEGSVDVSAVSVAAWPALRENYMILPHGGSVGVGYGPVIVSTSPSMTVEDLQRARIATPGLRTTAHLVSRLIAPEAEYSVVPITPYEAVFDAVKRGDVDAGIIIHEGRLTYPQHGLHAVVDLGAWWMEQTGLPLPLGANVIRRSLGPDVLARASRALRRSIRWALDHREEMIEFLISHIHRPEEVATPELLDRYLAMYANEETAGYSDASRRGMQRLFDLGAERALLPEGIVAEFVEDGVEVIR